MASATYHNESGETPQSPRLAELKAIFDAVDDTALLARLQAYRPTGRPGYPLRALWRAYLASFCLNLGNTNCLIRLLEDSPPLRELCGLDGPFPVRRTFNRFIRRLADHADLVADALAGVTEGLKELLPDLGQQVAVDSTAIRSHSNPNRKEVSDPEASWGVKHSVKSKNKDATEWFFGYKMPAVADANYGIPLAQFITTGRRNDSPELPALMARAKARHGWFQPAVAVADRGYDAASNHQYLYRQGITPVIHIRRPSNKTGLYQDIYTQDGVPTCLGMVPMEYVATNQVGHHLYRCRREGCHLLAAKSGIRHCDTEYWQDPTEDLRLFGVIRRQSRQWKELYGKRWKIEQTFKSLKESRRLESHCLRGLKHITLHALMSTLSYQATALVKAQAGQLADMRWMVRKVA